MITIVLKSSLLIAAIFGIRFLLGKRLSPAMRHAIWAIVSTQFFLLEIGIVKIRVFW